MANPRSIAYYITGHGFGHGTRACAVLKALIEKRGANLTLHLVTTLPPRIFRELDRKNTVIRFHPRRIDVGLEQKDGVDVDFPASVRSLREHLRGFERSVSKEAEFLEGERVECVVSDIPAVPILAAKRARRPAFAVGNFGWDEIYRAYEDEDPVFREARVRFSEAYAQATRLFKLPFSLDMSSFPEREDVPLVVRRAEKTSEEVERTLGLAGDPRPLVFVSFGGFGLAGFDVAPLAELSDFVFVLYGAPSRGPAPDHVLFVSDESFQAPDLVSAADAMISKPGYGLVAEAVAHQTAFLYAPRDTFPESPVLVEALRSHVPSAPLTIEELRAGGLRGKLREVLASRAYRPVARDDGAEVVASRIVELA